MGRAWFSKGSNHDKVEPMTETVSTTPDIRPAELAAYLAARMCHDFISPASAIVSGLDLLEDPTAHDMRADAMDLIAASARKLSDMLLFTRVAFGAAASAESFDPRELEKLTQGVFGHMRAELDWQVDLPVASKPVARALLNLAQIAGAALPTGGRARVVATEKGDRVVISIEASGPRARLRPEVLAGLRGEGAGDGLHGHWVQARYVSLFVADAAGTLNAEAVEEKVTLTATFPA